jgi:hypothetical protein
MIGLFFSATICSPTRPDPCKLEEVGHDDRSAHQIAQQRFGPASAIKVWLS